MLYVFDDCILDIQCCVLCRAGQPVRLRPKAFQVLHYLLRHRDRVVAKHELAAHLWPDQFISDAVLESTVRAVRRALGDDSHTQGYIQTLRGYGYRFVATVEERAAAGPGAPSPLRGAPHASGVYAMPALDDVQPCPTLLAPVPRAAALPPEVLLPPLHEAAPATGGPLPLEPPEPGPGLPLSSTTSLDPPGAELGNLVGRDEPQYNILEEPQEHLAMDRWE
jgi:DNA-binding winged helix-turn-helix (wHTH) protein